MVYLRGITIKTTMTLLIVTVFMAISSVEAATTKFAYKKPIFGKTTNAIKEKQQLKPKAEVPKATPTTSTTTAATTTTGTATTITTTTTASATTMATVGAEEAPKTSLNSSETGNEAEVEVEVEMQPSNSLEEKTEVTAEQAEEIVKVSEEDDEEDEELVGNIEMITEEHQRQQHEEEQQVATPVLDVPMDLEATTVTSATTDNGTTTSMPTTTTIERKGPIPCTCGIFLSSQIKRGSSEPPQSKPVIVNELERYFPCTAVGQKQCQTKCLETIVQHLPNSASILCATLNRDCRKERAYLFIKNCRDQWTNTNLAAGREYCCKGGQPYSCPMV